MSGESYSYAKAGVSIAAGNALVNAIKPLVRATRRTDQHLAKLADFGMNTKGG